MHPTLAAPIFAGFHLSHASPIPHIVALPIFANPIKQLVGSVNHPNCLNFNTLSGHGTIFSQGEDVPVQL